MVSRHGLLRVVKHTYSLNNTISKLTKIMQVTYLLIKSSLIKYARRNIFHSCFEVGYEYFIFSHVVKCINIYLLPGTWNLEANNVQKYEISISVEQLFDLSAAVNNIYKYKIANTIVITTIQPWQGNVYFTSMLNK